MSRGAAIQLRYPPFPKGRFVLLVTEVARRWRVSTQHIADLIELGALQAIDVSGGGSRRHWRIPQEAYFDFLERGHSLACMDFSSRRKAG